MAADFGSPMGDTKQTTVSLSGCAPWLDASLRKLEEAVKKDPMLGMMVEGAVSDAEFAFAETHQQHDYIRIELEEQIEAERHAYEELQEDLELEREEFQGREKQYGAAADGSRGLTVVLVGSDGSARG